MASTTFIPFNFQPVSSQNTNSLTISLGQYAYAVPLEPQCTVDALLICAGTGYTYNTASGSRIVANNSFTGRIRTGNENSSKNLGYITGTGATASILSASGANRIDAWYLNGTLTSVSSGSLITTAVTTDSGGLITFSSASDTSITITPYTLSPLWLNEGAVLAGGNWLVTLYNKIT